MGKTPWKLLKVPMAMYISSLHVMSVWAVYRMLFVRCHAATLVMAGVLYVLVAFAITAGYHRCYTHRALKMHPVLSVPLLFIFAPAGMLDSLLVWASAHRWHHARPDTRDDPYGMSYGPFAAHFSYCFRTYKKRLNNVEDLRRDVLVRWQQRLYLPLAIVTAFGLPTLLASLWGDALGGLLTGGFLRLCAGTHAVSSVNSFSHSVGERLLGIKGSAVTITSRFLRWTLGPSTLGEALEHEGHHANSQAALLGDPLDFTGHALRLLERVGLVSELHRPRAH